MRTFFLLSFLLLTTALVAQKRFMAGVSVSTGYSLYSTNYPAHVSTVANSTITDSTSFMVTYYQIRYKAETLKNLPGSTLAAGLNFGVFLDSNFFVLTGIERTSTVIRNKYFSQNATFVYHSWDIPLLGNYMVTNKHKKVSLFISGGFVGGAYTSQVVKQDRPATPSNYPANPSNALYYANATLGLGCKIKLCERLCLLAIPNFAYKITDTQMQRMSTVSLRTMLMYCF